jgi:thymidine kinase
MQTWLLTGAAGRPGGGGADRVAHGIGAEAETLAPADDPFARTVARLAQGPCASVLIDAAQFLTPLPIWQLARAVDDPGVPVVDYGLQVDFRR